MLDFVAQWATKCKPTHCQQEKDGATEEMGLSYILFAITNKITAHFKICVQPNFLSNHKLWVIPTIISTGAYGPRFWTSFGGEGKLYLYFDQKLKPFQAILSTFCFVKKNYLSNLI